MTLAFCPVCRRASLAGETCPECHIPCDAQASTYAERLLITVLSVEPDRAGMIVDVLTRMLHDQRAVVPLILLLRRNEDPYPMVIAARGLGRLGDPQAIPALADLLLDENKPYVSRIAAAEALGMIGGDSAIRALKQATSSPRESVAKEAVKALDYLESNRKSKHA